MFKLIRKLKLPALTVIALTIWALIAHGYYFGRQDQRLDIPLVYAWNIQ